MFIYSMSTTKNYFIRLYTKIYLIHKLFVEKKIPSVQCIFREFIFYNKIHKHLSSRIILIAVTYLFFCCSFYASALFFMKVFQLVQKRLY